MGNFLFHKNVEDIHRDLLEELNIMVPGHRRTFEEAIEGTIKDITKITHSYNIVFQGMALTLITALVHYGSKQDTWIPKNSFPFFCEPFQSSNEIPQKYFPRKDIETKIKDLLNSRSLIIVYGSNLSGKTTTLNKILEERRGVIQISFQKGSHLLKEIGKILQIPEKKVNLDTIQKVFKEFKKKYDIYPLIKVKFDGIHHSSMNDWIWEGKSLTENGKSVCDCIFVFSEYESAFLSGFIVKSHSKYIRFDDLSKNESIEYLRLYDQIEPEKTIEELKTGRIGDLERIVNGKKAQYLDDKERSIKNATKIHGELLNKVANGEDNLLVLMNELSINEKELISQLSFKSVFIPEQILRFDFENFTVSFDSDFVKDKFEEFNK